MYEEYPSAKEIIEKNKEQEAKKVTGNVDTKIYLVTCLEEYSNEKVQGCPIKLRHPYTVVSHGVGNNTGRNYCLPCERPEFFKPKFDDIGMYINA